MASQGERQLEILTAFGGRTKKSKSRSRRTPSLAWMHSHCSSATRKGPGEFQLFAPYMGDLSKVPPFDFQSYHYWKSVMEGERFTHPRRYRRRTILIQPLSHSQASSGYRHTEIHPSILSHLCNFCEQFFHGMTVEVAPQIDLSQIRKLTKRVHQSTNREQFLVRDIRKFLQSKRPSRALCVVGVTVADLYPSPEWNFVLGEASMAQGCGVFSFGRYFNSSAAVGGGDSRGCHGDANVQRGGDSEVEQLRNLWVLMRVMSHELCHIFGLKHCFYFDCAMNESNSIVEAATQPLFLCPVCLRKMQKAVKFDPLERYRQMLKVIKQLHSAFVKASDDEDQKVTDIENESVPSVTVEDDGKDIVQSKARDESSAAAGDNELGFAERVTNCASDLPNGTGVIENKVTGNNSSVVNVLGVAKTENCDNVISSDGVNSERESPVEKELVLAEREQCDSHIQRSEKQAVVAVCESAIEKETDGRTLLQANDQGIQRETEGSSASERGLVDDVATSSHNEQFEGAVLWLEKVVSSLGQFEDQWVGPRAGRHTRNKVL